MSDSDGRSNDRMADWLTYSRRTENANTTVAFNPSLMRRDHTSNSEMPKMKTSNAIAVVSTPLHKVHCGEASVSKSAVQASVSQAIR